MDKAGIILEAKHKIEKWGASELTQSIARVLFEQSKNLTRNVYLTLTETTNPFIRRQIENATGDMEDLAGGQVQLNQFLTQSGSTLEFFAGPGHFNLEGKFKSRIAQEKIQCTFWLCKRGRYHKHAELHEVTTSYLKLINGGKKA